MGALSQRLLPVGGEVAHRVRALLDRHGYAEGAPGPLADLFRHGLVLEGAHLEATDARDLADAGTVVLDGDAIRPVVRIDVWEGLLVAHDPFHAPDIGPDTVIGVNNTTRSLSALIPQTRALRALDVGTGSGALALGLARRGSAVTGTDLSERALDLAALNAALNDTHLDLRQGDLYEPVGAQERFDLIVANLPFVVSPHAAYTFRDGGRQRDGMTREGVLGAAPLLADGGLAIIHGNWTVEAAGSSEVERPLGWLDSTGCSGIVLHHATIEPEAYARRWNQFLASQDRGAFEEAVAQWVRAFQEWGVTGIAEGSIVLHRSAGPRPVVTALRMSSGPYGDGGTQVLRILHQSGWLSQRPDERALLDTSPRLLPGTFLDQRLEFSDGWVPAPARLSLRDTCGVSSEVPASVVAPLLQLDGHRTLAEVIDSAAGELGQSPSELREVTLPTVAGLLRSGCLELA